MPHLTSVASRAAILDFEVPRSRIITEIFAEILFVTVPKMKVSYLLDILVGGVCNINQLPVGEVLKRRSLSACPQFLVDFASFGGMGTVWDVGCVWLWGCVGGGGWDRWAWKKLRYYNINNYRIDRGLRTTGV